jgi:hypothetical protein
MPPTWHCPVCRAPFTGTDLDTVAEDIRQCLSQHDPADVVAAAAARLRTDDGRPSQAASRQTGLTMAPRDTAAVTAAREDARTAIDRLRAALDALHETDDPCADLAQVRRLRALLGDVEDAAVQVARSRGALWSSIAAVLSLSVIDLKARYRAARSSATAAISSQAAAR